MSDLNQLYDEREIEAYKDSALIEATTIADLICKGLIPRSKISRLHEVIGEEQAYLVSEAVETMDAMNYTVEREMAEKGESDNE